MFVRLQSYIYLYLPVLRCPGITRVPERINETRLIRPHSDPSFADEKFRGSSGGPRMSPRTPRTVVPAHSGRERVEWNEKFYVRLRSVGRRRGDLAVYTKRQRSQASPEHVEMRKRASEDGRGREIERANAVQTGGFGIAGCVYRQGNLSSAWNSQHDHL